MKIVLIISPYAGDVEDNLAYARACLFDALTRGEAPYASHLLYPQVLDDADPAHRKMGMKAGHEFLRFADIAAVYMDHGLSLGMKADITAAHKLHCNVEERWLSRWNPVG